MIRQAFYLFLAAAAMSAVNAALGRLETAWFSGGVATAAALALLAGILASPSVEEHIVEALRFKGAAVVVVTLVPLPLDAGERVEVRSSVGTVFDGHVEISRREECARECARAVRSMLVDSGLSE